MDGPKPTSNYSGYVQAVSELDLSHPETWTFKSDERYTRILEHTRRDTANECLDLALLEFPGIVEVARETILLNDSLGNPPRQHVFEKLGISCATSNFPYVWQALVLLRRLDSLQWCGNVIELGGGYGGMALFVSAFLPLFPRVTIQSYRIIDLPEIIPLAAAYLGVLGVPVKTYNGLDARDLRRALRPSPSFALSVYAFSEFTDATREWYASRLLKHCQHGFIVWNLTRRITIEDVEMGGPVYPFIDAELEIEPERPNVDLGWNNQFVWW